MRWRNSFSACLAGLVLILAAAVGMFTSRPAPPLSPTDELREAYFGVDYERGVAVGRRLMEKHANEPEFLAWLALNEARGGEAEDAKTRAENLARLHPGNPWSDFAVAGAHIFDEDADQLALDASERAFKSRPNAPEFVWIRAETLRLRQRQQEAIDLVEAFQKRTGVSPLTASVAGSAKFDLAMAEGFPEEQVQTALAALDVGRETAGGAVLNGYLSGWYLSSAGAWDDALPYLDQVVKRSNSPRVHQAYWTAVARTPSIPDAKKRRLLGGRISRTLKSNGDSPLMFYGAASVLRSLQMERQAATVTDELIARFPGSIEASRLELDRISAQVARGARGPAVIARLKEISLRPQVARSTLAEDVAVILLEALNRDPRTADASLVAAAEDLIATSPEDPLVYFSASITLIDRLPAVAQQIAARGLAQLAAGGLLNEFPDEETKTRESLAVLSMLNDVVGQSFAKQEMYQAAIAAYERAYRADGTSASVLSHFAEALIEGNDLAGAKRRLGECKSLASQQVALCDVALQKLQRRSALAGLDAAEITDQVRALSAEYRTRRILSERLRGKDAPIIAASFSDFNGETYRLDDYRGAIVVLTVWGGWCEVCKVALPELENFARSRRADPGVVFLSINDERAPAVSRDWVRRNDFSLPVLRGRAFARQNDISAVPSTWILDQRGAKAFVITGHTPQYDIEVAERIRLIRERPSEPLQARAGRSQGDRGASTCEVSAACQPVH